MKGTTRLAVVALAAALAPLQSFAQGCNTPDRAVLLILDASASMNATLPDGETRIAAVRAAVKAAIGGVAADAPLGVRLYGSLSPRVDRNCADTVLAVPFAPASGQGAAVGAAVEGAIAQGHTALATMLAAVAADFPAGAAQRAVVLVGDGKENCAGDPVLAARMVAGQGIAVHTIGFAADDAARMQLKAIAGATGGTYADAADGAALQVALTAAFAACPGPPEVIAEGTGTLATAAAPMPLPVVNSATGAEVGRLDAGALQLSVPAGVYEVRFGAGSWKGIVVRPGETTTIVPVELTLDPPTDARVVDSETGVSFGDFEPGRATRVLMPGVYDLRFEESAWRYIEVTGTNEVLHPARVELDPKIKWKDHGYVTTLDGTIAGRFDEETHMAILPPGQYIVDLDEAKLPFDATVPGAILEVRLQ